MKTLFALFSKKRELSCFSIFTNNLLTQEDLINVRGGTGPEPVEIEMCILIADDR